MDASDLFRKLITGTKFDLRRFEKDAKRFNLIKAKEPAPKISSDFQVSSSLVLEDKLNGQNLEISRNSNEEGDRNEDNYSSNEDIEESELKLLGGITSKSKINYRKSKKKKKKFKKLSKDKIAVVHHEEMNHVRNAHKIHVVGTDIPDPILSFDELKKKFKISENIFRNVESEGYKKPTPIQMQAIPLLISGRETLACAPTGSGKTAAFLIPIIHHLKEPRKLGIRAVIVSPTRELANQTFRECTRLSEGTNLKIYFMQKAHKSTKILTPESSKKFDILITTPNRLVYMINQEPPCLSLSNVEYLVVDEADKLFEAGKQGFRDQLAVIYQACDSANVRRAMFSATYTHDVETWCKLNLDNIVTVSVGVRNSAADLVEQELLFVGEESGKLLAFRDLIVKGKLEPPVLVFVQSKDRAKELFKELIYDGINVDVIHAERSQQQRDNVVKSFRSGKIWVLIATELMGRGIDFKGVNLVVNYDFPPTAISYIHRIGRTGRAGRTGKAVTFFTEDDSSKLRSIAQVMKNAGCKVPKYMLELKKPTREERKKLKTMPERKSISTTPLYDTQKRKRKQEAKEASLKKARKAV